MTLFNDSDLLALEEELRREHARAQAEGVRFAADDAGALIHERRGLHARDERCLDCGKAGRKLLEQVAGFGARAAGEPRLASNGLTDEQNAVLLMFRDAGQMSDDEVAATTIVRPLLLLPSGARAIREQLVAKGLLTATSLRRPTGAPVWGITADGLRAIRRRKSA